MMTVPGGGVFVVVSPTAQIKTLAFSNLFSSTSSG